MSHYHLYAIGNALVDTEYEVSDALLATMGVSKRHMTLIDAERTMCTFLGATAQLDRQALHPHDIAKAKVYYMEGYLAASPTGLDAALEGLALARQHGVQTALTLSDVSMINFCRAGLEAMAAGGLDYLFANEEEAQVWCASTDLETILAQLQKLARTVCLTRGPKGCIVLHGSHMADVPAVPTQAVDTNGAGDMFAGAFLYGVTHGMTQAEAAALANRAAAAVVSQHGNRLTREQMQALRQA